MEYEEFEKFIDKDRTEPVRFRSERYGEVTLSTFHHNGCWCINIGPLSIYFDDVSYFVAGHVDLRYRRWVVGSLDISDMEEGRMTDRIFIKTLRVKEDGESQEEQIPMEEFQRLVREIVGNYID